MNTLRVAAGQAPAACNSPEENALTGARLAEEAADAGARLLVLPEAFLTNYCPLAFAAPPTEAEVVRLLDPVRALAQGRGIDVLVSTPVARPGGATLSLAHVDAAGQVSLPYDKQHLSGAAEQSAFVPGRGGASVDVDGWRVALSVCYDGSFPEHARAAALDGAFLYVNSAAFFVGGEHRRDLYTASRALDNGIYALFSGATGECAHLGAPAFSGGSSVYDPEGRPLVRMGLEPGVVVADLDAGLLLATRADHPMLEDRRAWSSDVR